MLSAGDGAVFFVVYMQSVSARKLLALALQSYRSVITRRGWSWYWLGSKQTEGVLADDDLWRRHEPHPMHVTLQRPRIVDITNLTLHSFTDFRFRLYIFSP
jgi:hypothetical protein